MKFYSTSNTSLHRCYYPLFQNYRINHPSPSQLTSRIHPLIFLWTPKGFISPESSLNFFLILYIPPSLQKRLKLTVLRLLANTLVSQKIEYVHFCSCSEAKPSPRFLSLLPRQKEITHSSRTAFSKDLFFPSRIRRGWGLGEGRRIMELKKLPKLNLRGYWSQVLINSAILATFTFLVSVLLCHNLASSMLKCAGSLT